jgi:hypothetical protein
MKAEEFEKEFLLMPEKEQMNILQKILPVLCRTMAGDPQKAWEMFSLRTEECSGPMATMISMMGKMSRIGGVCCE